VGGKLGMAITNAIADCEQELGRVAADLAGFTQPSPANFGGFRRSSALLVILPLPAWIQQRQRRRALALGQVATRTSRFA
jgi:hypothetical protein